MGPKSKSSTQQTSTQSTTQGDISGVVAGDAYQGETITITENFPDNVAAAFNQLINLVGKTVDVAERTGSAAITAVAQRTETATQPEVSTVNKLVPVAIIISLGVAATMVFRR